VHGPRPPRGVELGAGADHPGDEAGGCEECERRVRAAAGDGGEHAGGHRAGDHRRESRLRSGEAELLEDAGRHVPCGEGEAGDGSEPGHARPRRRQQLVAGEEGGQRSDGQHERRRDLPDRPHAGGGQDDGGGGRPAQHDRALGPGGEAEGHGAHEPLGEQHLRPPELGPHGDGGDVDRDEERTEVEQGTGRRRQVGAEAGGRRGGTHR
jgi:hypothetical protein